MDRMRPTPQITAVLAALVLLSSLLGRSARAESNALAVSPLPPVSNPDGRFGIVQGIHAPGLAYNAGARWDRIIFPWSLIQKDGPDSWTELYFTDEAIRAQAGRGVTMVGVMIYTPQWASVNPTYGRPVDRPQGLDLPYNDPRNHWGQFVRKLVARHKGVVDHWVLWNEPDFYDPAVRYTWEGSHEDYFQLLKVAYLNTKEVNPQAKVIAGGFAYWWDKEHARPPYLGPLLDVIARDPDHQRHNHYFDIVGVHVYAAPLNAYAQSLLMWEIMESRGVHKPMWVSESNVAPVDDPGNELPPGGLRATLDQQASYVIQSMALALAAGVERYAIYKMIDEEPENNTELWGLARNDLSVRPAYVAYQVGAAYFANVRSAVYSWPGSAEVPTPAEVRSILRSNDGRPQFVWPSQVSQVTMERGRHRTTVVWNNSPVGVTHKVAADAKQATLVTKEGKTRAIAPRDGAYVLDLPGSTHNPDQRDWSIYMIGGDPFILDEDVAPLPTERVASRIELVWPHGGAADATKANVTAQLLLPGPTRPGGPGVGPERVAESVPCRYSPRSVQLWAKRKGGARELVATGVRRMADEDGVRYPVWDFNDVDVAFARASTAAPDRGEDRGSAPAEGGERARDRANENFIEFSVAVDGIQTDAAVWTYGGPNATDWTKPPARPQKSCE